MMNEADVAMDQVEALSDDKAMLEDKITGLEERVAVHRLEIDRLKRRNHVLEGHGEGLVDALNEVIDRLVSASRR